MGKIVTVTFKLAGGNISGSAADITRTGAPGASFTAPANPTKDGYTFNDWNPPLPTPPVFPAADTTYTAQWQEIPKPGMRIKEGISAEEKSYGESGTDDLVPNAEHHTNTNPLIIYKESGQAKLSITGSSDTTAYYRIDAGSETQGTEINLSADGNAHKLTVWAKKGTDDSIKTVLYVQVKDALTTYKELKNVVTHADDNAVIMVKNIIAASSAAGNNGEIVINKNITIQGTNKTSETLDAGSFSRIFRVKDGKTLTLQNITLTGGNTKNEQGDKNGGGVYIENGSCTMVNVLVVECTADAGGAVYVNEGTFSISGDTRITPSTREYEQTAGKNDVYLKNGKVITVTGTLTGTTPIARITPERYPTSSTPTVTVLEGSTVNTEYTKFKVTDEAPTKKWKINASGELEAVGGQSPAIEATSWEDLRTKVQSASDGTVIEIAKNLTYNIAAAGTNKSTITVKKNIIIKSKAGNTYTLNAGGKGADSEQSNDKSTGVFEVDDDKTLTLENLALTMAEKYAVYVDPNSSLKMKNVTIKDCKTNFNAAGIYFNKGTDLTLEHCTIEKCKGKGSQSSGGINIQEPKGMVSIKDTTIENCEATSANSTGGGIYLYNVKNTQCKLENVTVNNCSALRGGGIHAKAGTLTISGCSFTKNVASGSIANGGGGAIYSEGAEITIIGCTIGDNNTNGGNYAVQGGGIFVNPNAKCILKAGTKISGNTAMQIGSEGGNGGGIFVNRVSSGTTAGILTIEGAKTSHVIISGNTADFGGGLYSHGKADIKYVEIKENSVEHDGGGMFNAGTCTMDNVSIENNKASHRTSSAGNGGGIYSDKELMLKHTAVIGNTAKMYGGAIYIDDSVFNMSGSTVITVEQSGGATAPSKNDIYLTNTAFITLTGKLTAAEKIARITLNSAGGYKETRVVVKGGGGFNITVDYKNKFTITDKLTNPKKWELDFTGSELKLKKK